MTDRESGTEGFRCCFIKGDEAGIAAEVKVRALPSVGGGEGSEEVARRPGSVPSVKAVRGSTGTADHGSGKRIAGTCVCRKSPVRTSRSDVKGSTGKEISRWNIEVAKPHSGPVLAQIAEMVRREREPTQA